MHLRVSRRGRVERGAGCGVNRGGAPKPIAKASVNTQTVLSQSGTPRREPGTLAQLCFAGTAGLDVPTTPCRLPLQSLPTSAGTMPQLDPHERPPDSIRNVYKRYQKMPSQQLDADADIIDLDQAPHTLLPDKVRVVQVLEAAQLEEAFGAFAGRAVDSQSQQPSVAIYEHTDMAGKMGDA